MLSLSAAALTLAFAAAEFGEGMPAPSIEAKDWMNHRPSSLEKERGRVVVVEFWATW